MKKTTIHFTVKGRGAFPIDMLRYDRCTPASETDSFVIRRSYESGGREFSVRIQRDGVGRSWKPCVERWRSFNWEVVENSLEVQPV